MSKADQAAKLRLELNLKNLRRHDSTIDKIIGATSYATVYYNEGEGWTKTNIEGPMFLFSRNVTPSYGFFILNRNGLEYVKEFLTEDSEVRMEGEIILYEPLDAERATGIWIFEEKERKEICTRMEMLRMSSTSKQTSNLASPITALPLNKSIPIDMLFATAPKADPIQSNIHTSLLPVPTGMSILDDMFAKAKISPAIQARSLPSPQSGAEAAVPSKESLAGFKSSSVVNQSNALSATALLAMIGVSPPDAAIKGQHQHQHEPPNYSSLMDHNEMPTSQLTMQRTEPATSLIPTKSSYSTTTFAPPPLSHDIFSILPLPKNIVPKHSKKQATSDESRSSDTATHVNTASVGYLESLTVAPLERQTHKGKVSEGQERVGLPLHLPSPSLSSVASPSSSSALEKSVAMELLDSAAIESRLGMTEQTHSGDDREPLNKSEFVIALRDLLAKPSFNTKLYARYLKRFAAEY